MDESAKKQQTGLIIVGILATVFAVLLIVGGVAFSNYLTHLEKMQAPSADIIDVIDVDSVKGLGFRNGVRDSLREFKDALAGNERHSTELDRRLTAIEKRLNIVKIPTGSSRDAIGEKEKSSSSNP